MAKWSIIIIQDNSNEFNQIDDKAKNVKLKNYFILKIGQHSFPSILNEGRLIHKEREVTGIIDAEKFKSDNVSKDPFEK